MRALGAFVVLLGALVAPLRADSTFYPAGSVLAPLSSEDNSPRGNALGGADTALDGDLYGAHGNPASVAGLSRDVDIGLQYGLLNPLADVTLEEGIIGTHLDIGSLVLDASYYYSGLYEFRDIYGDLYGSTYFNDWDLGLAWGYNFFDNHLSVGLELDDLAQYLNGAYWIRLEGSAGLIWHFTNSFSLAASLQNAKLNYDTATDLDTQVTFGTRLGLTPNIDLLTDLDYPVFDQSSKIRAGLEWRTLRYLALRFGWRQNLTDTDADMESGPTAGIGVRVRSLSLDYAYMDYSGVSDQRLAFTFALPERWINKPTVVIDVGGGTAAAQAYLEQARQLEMKDDPLDALVAYKESLQASPNYPGAAERLVALEDGLNIGKEGAVNSDVQEAFKNYVDAAIRFETQGEFKKAINSLEIALEFDKRNVEAVEKLKEIQGKLDNVVATHLSSADGDLSSGDLDAAVYELNEALKVDPDQPAVKDKLSSLKPKILAEIKRLHREGIDAYVAGHYDAASDSWKKALALDPADPDNVAHDLQKVDKIKAMGH